MKRHLMSIGGNTDFDIRESLMLILRKKKDRGEVTPAPAREVVGGGRPITDRCYRRNQGEVRTVEGDRSQIGATKYIQNILTVGRHGVTRVYAEQEGESLWTTKVSSAGGSLTYQRPAV